MPQSMLHALAIICVAGGAGSAIGANRPIAAGVAAGMLVVNAILMHRSLVREEATLPAPAPAEEK